MVIKIIINEDHAELHGPFKFGKRKIIGDQNDSCMRKEIFICLK